MSDQPYCRPRSIRDHVETNRHHRDEPEEGSASRRRWIDEVPIFWLDPLQFNHPQESSRGVLCARPRRGARRLWVHNWIEPAARLAKQLVQMPLTVAPCAALAEATRVSLGQSSMSVRCRLVKGIASLEACPRLSPSGAASRVHSVWACVCRAVNVGRARYRSNSLQGCGQSNSFELSPAYSEDFLRAFQWLGNTGEEYGV